MSDIQISQIKTDIELVQDNLQISQIKLNAEVLQTNLQISQINNSVEFGYKNLQVSQINTQVEVLLPSTAFVLIDKKFFPGQYIKIFLNDKLHFNGIIANTDYSRVNNADEAQQNIFCIGLEQIATRRTVKIAYLKGTYYSAIVSDMIYILRQDGINSGEILTGNQLDDNWVDDCISISQVLDEIAQKNGFQWNIDDEFRLNFYENPTTIPTAKNLIEDGNFSEFRDVKIYETIDNYTNKSFILGGNDETNNIVYVNNSNLDLQNEKQLQCGGTGTYGNIIKNPSIVETLVKTSVSCTSSTIYIKNHNWNIGEMYYNKTLKQFNFIKSLIDANNVYCDNLAGQKTGDTIIRYPQPNQLSQNILKKLGCNQQRLEFKTFYCEFIPQSQLRVTLSDMSISGYFNIEEVSISHVANGYFESDVKAYLKNADSFSVQNTPNYIDYFRNF